MYISDAVVFRTAPLWFVESSGRRVIVQAILLHFDDAFEVNSYRSSYPVSMI